MTRRVLVVEDDPDIRSSVAELLEGEGYVVATAPNGSDAFSLLRGAETLPSLILLDLTMPDMDGFQFRAAQLADPRLAAIPVVLMSAGGELDSKARQLGVQGVLQKPFRDLETIFRSVGRFF